MYYLETFSMVKGNQTGLPLTSFLSFSGQDSVNCGQSQIVH